MRSLKFLVFFASVSGPFGSRGQGDYAAANEVVNRLAAKLAHGSTGRVVAIKNPGQGWQTARYDAVDHALEVRDPRGARQVAQWDEAGRLRQLQRYAPDASEPEQSLSWTYAGPWADEETIADADGMRSIRTGVRIGSGMLFHHHRAVFGLGSGGRCLGLCHQIDCLSHSRSP